MPKWSVQTVVLKQNEKSDNVIYKPRNFHIPVYLDREYMRSYTQTDTDDSTRILSHQKIWIIFYRNYMYILIKL